MLRKVYSPTVLNELIRMKHNVLINKPGNFKQGASYVFCK